MTTSTGSGQSVPEHRSGTAARSGDTQVIGADGAARNIDQEARVLRQAQDERDAVAARAGRKPGASRSEAPADTAKAD